MCLDKAMTSLGFMEEKIPVGAHICQIFNDDDERIDSLLKFLLSGVEARERSTCFSDKTSEETVRKYFSTHNIIYDERKQNSEISLAGAKDIYIPNNVFDPDRMLNTLRNFHQESLDLGFTAARAIGEMIPEVQNATGGSRLIEYESRITLLLKEYPVTTVCQYDTNVFSGAVIMDVLKVHPHVIIRGSVVHNPFYMQPHEILRE